MATNQIFTISGKQCSLVRRATSTRAIASPTSIAAAKTSPTAVPDLNSQTASSPAATEAQLQPAPDASSTAQPTVGSSSTSDGRVSVTGGPATTATLASSNDGDHNSGSGNQLNVGIVVGMIITALVLLGVGGAVWLFMRRKRRRRLSAEPSEKSGEKSAMTDEGSDTSSFDWDRNATALIASAKARLSYLKTIIGGKVAGTVAARVDQLREWKSRRDDRKEVQAAEAIVAAAAISSSQSPPKSKSSPEDRPKSRLKSFRPLSVSSVTDRSWLGSLEGPHQELVIANPSPPTPDALNPFADPIVASKSPTKVTTTSPSNQSDLRNQRRRSTSFPAEAKPNTPFAASQPSSSSIPRRSNDDSRSSSHSSNLSYSNRGPSFYPPATGPLPRFSEIGRSNPFVDPVEPVPALPKMPLPTAYGGPNPAWDHHNTNKPDRGGDSRSSSIVLLPDADASDRMPYDLSTGYANDVAPAGPSTRRSSAGQRSQHGSSDSQSSGRASSLILKPPNLDSNLINDHSQAVDSDDYHYHITNLSNNTNNNNTSSSTSAKRGTNSNNPNPMDWRLPRTTPSGSGYVASGLRGSTVSRGSTAAVGNGIGRFPFGGAAARDTTYTTRSDPFDLESDTY